MMLSSRFRLQPIHKGFYTTNDVLSLNPEPRVIFSMGARGTGKTLGWKVRSIYEFLDNNLKTLYIRRFKNELNDSKSDYLKDIFDADPSLESHNFDIKGNKMYVDDKHMLDFIPLSRVLKTKSRVFKEYGLIILDEFLTLDKTLTSYGYNEILMFNEFMSTVLRATADNPHAPIFVLLSNALSTTSEYFKLFGWDEGINPTMEYQYPKHTRKVVIEIPHIEGFKEKMEVSLINELLPSDSQWKKYAIENEFVFENSDNIVRQRDMKGHKNYYATIKTDNEWLHMYIVGSRYYITNKHFYKDVKDKIFTFDKSLVEEGVNYLSNNTAITHLITSAIVNGNIYFSNMTVKKELLTNLKKIITTFY